MVPFFYRATSPAVRFHTDWLRATSPALRFHSDGGPFVRSCPLWPWWIRGRSRLPTGHISSLKVAADCLRATSPAVRFHGGGRFYSAASPSHSGRGGFEVGAGRLRAMSPALRFHGDGGLFDRSCPSDRGGFEGHVPSRKVPQWQWTLSPQLPRLAVVIRHRSRLATGHVTSLKVPQ
ncbi:hypothetical protein V5799_030947 [Amblyomma americanum]|uniref:Uncharacterized protein n=1 Tax=Amblyomma americanum TaxID=6943 RepID=A0AAQ4ELX3_AMBAM